MEDEYKDRLDGYLDARGFPRTAYLGIEEGVFRTHVSVTYAYGIPELELNAVMESIESLTAF